MTYLSTRQFCSVNRTAECLGILTGANISTYITTCLRNRLVPPTNNMSERTLRSTKVKMRVSSIFRTFHGAQDYAILRSIIDTAILQEKHPFDALVRPEIILI